MPPTKTRLGIKVPYFGVWEAVGAGVAERGDVSPDEQLWAIYMISPANIQENILVQQKLGLPF